MLFSLSLWKNNQLNIPSLKDQLSAPFLLYSLKARFSMLGISDGPGASQPWHCPSASEGAQADPGFLLLGPDSAKNDHL